jgi:hypothetical protein
MIKRYEIGPRRKKDGGHDAADEREAKRLASPRRQAFPATELTRE